MSNSQGADGSPSRLTDPRLVSVVSILWCVVIVTMYWWCGGMDTDTGYILWNFGPSEKLYFIGLHINPWERWVVFNTMIVVDTILNIWALEVLFTWITLEVYDRSKDDAGSGDVMFSDRVTVAIAASYNFYAIIHGIVWLYLALTSADTQLLIIFLSVTLTACIVRLYLRDKHRRAAIAARKRAPDIGTGTTDRFQSARGSARLNDLAPRRSWGPRRETDGSDNRSDRGSSPPSSVLGRLSRAISGGGRGRDRPTEQELAPLTEEPV